MKMTKTTLWKASWLFWTKRRCSLACQVLPELPKSISESPEALLRLQRTTTAIWAQAYADKDLNTLLSYGVDPYIQHNPLAPSGKAIAQVGMTQIFATPGLINNATRVVFDLDYVAVHVHRIPTNTVGKAISGLGQTITSGSVE
ncbi:Carboxylic ester hydrolase [Fusarium sp. LHS14.1]|nr:Carboxylic ester hydrolase [Fusarium sp. LHS14.1]